MPAQRRGLSRYVTKKLFIQTFGCQMNEYDSSRIADQLRDTLGMSRTDDPEQADLLLLNTCSVREKAQEKVFSQLGRWRELKQERPDLLIGVGGCVASQEGESILQRAPFVDLVFGPQTLHRLPDMLRRRQADVPVVDISFPELEKFKKLPAQHSARVSAYVSIMEGCSKYCTFCVVPYTRGEEFSRPFDDVLAEAVDLAQQGVREITLLGQNVNAYQGVMHDGVRADFALLLRYLHEIDGIERIRYTTSHPLDFNQNLIDVYADLPKLVSHLHLPVQSGSDQILRAMKRRYTAQDYLLLVEQLRAKRPQLSLSSDFIVGYPGETDDDFADTMALIEKVGFDQSYSFVYSPRPGTPASELKDDVPPEVKQRRLGILQQRIKAMSMQYSAAMVGSKQRVLVDRVAKKGGGLLSGRCDNNRVVNFSAPAGILGKFVDVLITESLPNSLRGRLLQEEVNAPVATAAG